MTDEEWVARFTRDLDRVVQGGAPLPGPAPAEYQARIALAQALAGRDPSAASTMRLPLRRRLLTAPGARRRPFVPAWLPDLGWGLTRAAPLALVLLLAVGLLAWGAERVWLHPGADGALLTISASPTLAQALPARPRAVSTPAAGTLLLVPVPAPTAGNSLQAAASALPTDARPAYHVTPADIRTTTGIPRP